MAATPSASPAPALPTIGRALHDVEHLPWVATAYAG
jgi:hypothetical protein